MKILLNIVQNWNHQLFIKFLYVLFVFCFLIIHKSDYGQTDKISIKIEDSVVYKSKHQNAIKLRLDISSNKADTVMIENFRQLVPANPFFDDSDSNVFSEGNCSYDALFFIVEDTNHNSIVPNNFILTNRAYKSDQYNLVLDTLTLRYKKKGNYSLPEKENFIFFKKDRLTIYIDIDKFYYLPKGIYFLYIYYCNTSNIKFTNNQSFNKKSKPNKFYGSMTSNKIQLTIK